MSLLDSDNKEWSLGNHAVADGGTQFHYYLLLFVVMGCWCLHLHPAGKSPAKLLVLPVKGKSLSSPRMAWTAAKESESQAPLTYLGKASLFISATLSARR